MAHDVAEAIFKLAQKLDNSISYININIVSYKTAKPSIFKFSLEKSTQWIILTNITTHDNDIYKVKSKNLDNIRYLWKLILDMLIDECFSNIGVIQRDPYKMSASNFLEGLESTPSLYKKSVPSKEPIVNQLLEFLVFVTSSDVKVDYKQPV